MANKIREIGNVLGASGRSNKYRVHFTWPGGVQGSTPLNDVDVLAKSAIAPQREIGVIELWNQGRKLPIPGDTTFDNTWALDFYLTENHALRVDMIKWQNACDNFHKNIHSGKPEAVMTSLKVEQLDSAGNVSAQYTLHNCFPTVVGEVTWGDDSENTPTEFNVTFSYSDWVVGSGEEDTCTPMQATGNDTGLSC